MIFKKMRKMPKNRTDKKEYFKDKIAKGWNAGAEKVCV